MYTVTRQRQWPEGTPVVEVSSGGLDYTNPDALVPKYPGEFEEYDDPVEAAEAAIAVCQSWRRDGELEAQVAHGATLGFTMTFDWCSFEDLRAWARREREHLPKCDRCGGILGKELYGSFLQPDSHYCSLYCVEEALAAEQRR